MIWIDLLQIVQLILVQGFDVFFYNIELIMAVWHKIKQVLILLNDSTLDHLDIKFFIAKCFNFIWIIELTLLLHPHNFLPVHFFFFIYTFILTGNKSISCIKQSVNLLIVTCFNKLFLITIFTELQIQFFFLKVHYHWK